MSYEFEVVLLPCLLAQVTLRRLARPGPIKVDEILGMIFPWAEGTIKKLMEGFSPQALTLWS